MLSDGVGVVSWLVVAYKAFDSGIGVKIRDRGRSRARRFDSGYISLSRYDLI